MLSKILCVFNKGDCQGGGGIISARNQKFMKTLSETSFLFLESAASLREKIEQICFSKANPIASKNCYLHICQQIKKFSGTTVYLDSSLFGCFAKVAKDRGLRVVTFFHNIETIYFKKVRKFYLPWVKRLEKNAIRYSDKIILLNERDKRDFFKTYGSLAEENAYKISIIPVTFENRLFPEEIEEYSRRQQSRRPIGIFVGSDFVYNINGIKWFIENVSSYLNMDFRIVGRGLGKYRDKLERKNVAIIDKDFDIKKEIMDADFYFNPVYQGSGMKVKTAEALMFGKTIFSTQEGWEGYSLDYEKAGGLCESAAEFIEKISKAEKEKQLRPYNAYSRAIFEQKYSDESALKQFSEILR